MMQIILMTMMTLNSYMFMKMKHPMPLGLIVLLQTMMTSMLTGLMSKTFWFSYILFLIFIGGLLILFMYMSSLTPNLMMHFSFNFIAPFILMSLIISLLFLDKFFFVNQNIINMENLKMNKHNLINMNAFMLSKLYDLPNNFITILMIIYLLLTLIIIVKISNNFLGPLRKKN